MSDPIVLADGTLVYKDGRVVKPDSAENNVRQLPSLRVVEVPRHSEAQALVVNVRKKLSDLPEVPKTMNAVSAILSYSLFGLDDDEISLAIGISAERIRDIRGLDAFTSMRNDVVANILNAEQGEVRDLFVKHAREAAKQVVSVMSNGKAADRLKAASDILDRSGFRPADVHEHRHRHEGGLTIEVIRKDNNAPVLDLNIERD